MKLILLILLPMLACAALFVLVRLVRGRNKRRLLADAHGIGCNLSEAFGISLLCSGFDTPEAIDALLAAEYSRFEVVAVLDAAAWPDEFARLTSRYRMIRVEWRGSSEFPQAGVRSLWRSRRRNCRRFVLVDRPSLRLTLPASGDTSPERAALRADWLAAASVAAYDYLLPLEAGVSLLPDAVTRLVAELGEYPAGRIARIQTRVGVPVRLIHRDLLLEADGFGGRPLRSLAGRQSRTLWEPLACRADRRRMGRGSWAGGVLAASFLLAGWAAARGWWLGAAVAATLALVAAAAVCIRQTVARMSGGRCRALYERP